MVRHYVFELGSEFKFSEFKLCVSCLNWSTAGLRNTNIFPRSSVWSFWTAKTDGLASENGTILWLIPPLMPPIPSWPGPTLGRCSQRQESPLNPVTNGSGSSAPSREGQEPQGALLQLACPELSQRRDCQEEPGTWDSNQIKSSWGTKTLFLVDILLGNPQVSVSLSSWFSNDFLFNILMLYLGLPFLDDPPFP